MKENTHLCIRTEEIAKLRTSVIVANTHMVELRREVDSMKSTLNKILILVIGGLLTGIITLVIK
jgi:hypothetical protein